MAQYLKFSVFNGIKDSNDSFDQQCMTTSNGARSNMVIPIYEPSYDDIRALWETCICLRFGQNRKKEINNWGS